MFMVLIIIRTGACKPTYNVLRPHIVPIIPSLSDVSMGSTKLSGDRCRSLQIPLAFLSSIYIKICCAHLSWQNVLQCVINFNRIETVDNWTWWAGKLLETNTWSASFQWRSPVLVNLNTLVIQCFSVGLRLCGLIDLPSEIPSISTNPSLRSPF